MCSHHSQCLDLSLSETLGTIPLHIAPLSSVRCELLLMPKRGFHSREAPVPAMQWEEGSRSCSKPSCMELHKQSPKEKSTWAWEGCAGFQERKIQPQTDCRACTWFTWLGFGCLPVQHPNKMHLLEKSELGGIVKSAPWQ